MSDISTHMMETVTVNLSQKTIFMSEKLSINLSELANDLLTKELERQKSAGNQLPQKTTT